MKQITPKALVVAAAAALAAQNASASNTYNQGDLILAFRESGFNEVGMRKNYYPAENGREDAMILAIEL